ncbi:hypothetical protein PUN28_013370 [Cardiocondyla obscurior]|uniref:Uncharacterized protein n=1 Tax=Cardiocondyla obscurior TaxID=286306 RepID=A0AAW2FBF5_9HYME
MYLSTKSKLVITIAIIIDNISSHLKQNCNFKRRLIKIYMTCICCSKHAIMHNVHFLTFLMYDNNYREMIKRRPVNRSEFNAVTDQSCYNLVALFIYYYFFFFTRV